MKKLKPPIRNGPGRPKGPETQVLTFRVLKTEAAKLRVLINELLAKYKT